jgi:hypothetical protein
MSLPRLSLLLALVGAALIFVGVVVGPASVAGIEGAYFTRAAGIPAHDGVFSAWGRGLELLSPGDGNLWLGAGIAFAVAALATAIAHVAGFRLARAHD